MTARVRRWGGRVVSPLSLLAVAAGTALAFALLSPLAERREQQAREGPPDAVSLGYLKLDLERQPQNSVLRRALVQRLLAAGAFDEADRVCTPLLVAGEPSSRVLSAEIAFQRWMSQGPLDRAARSEWLARSTQRLRSLLGAALEPAALERLAEISVTLGERRLGAEFLDALARQDLREESVRRADAAYLAAGDPLGAARLWAALALVNERAPASAGYARLALERARSADQPQAALELFTGLRPHFAHDPELLGIGLALSGGLDDRLALGIARELGSLRPDDAALGQRIRELQVWTAPPRSGPAPVAAVTREQQIAEARAHWDLTRVLELTDGEPRERQELDDRVSLLEATGRISEALGVLDRASTTELGSDRALWGRELALQLAVGEIDASLQTLAQIQLRFGLGREDAVRKVNLLLALGRQREALDVLSALPEGSDADHTRQLISLAWELGDLERVRTALETLVRSPAAQAWDFERLWQVDYEAKDFRSALSTAQSGYARFPASGLLQLCIDAALAAHDEDTTLELLARAESSSSGLRADPGYWNLRTQIYQERTRRALARGQLAAARQSGQQSRDLLERAALVAPDGPLGYAALWAVQRRQELSLALEGNDTQTLAMLYEQQAPGLRPRERVAVLSRLGETAKAADVALTELHDDAPAENTPERDGLAADARSLTAALPRQLWLHTSAQSVPELFSLSLSGGAEYAFSEQHRLRAAAELTRFSQLPDSRSNLAALDLSDPSAAGSAIEAAGQVTGQLGGSELTLGVAARRGSLVQPFARFEQRLLSLEGTELRLGARLNDRTSETARLRLFGAEDQLSLSADVDLGSHAYLSASAAGQAYWQHDRTYLGSGATINAGTGYNLPLGSQLGTANFRVSTYSAPRLPEDRSAGFVPEGTTWIGIGTSLARGRLEVPPVFGRELSFLADATLGWLVPQQELGWSGRCGLGVSLLGADLLAVSASASNVFGTAPGFAAYTLSAEYRVSEWK